ncbi:MAG: WecB/TagA/CpsF family glycosyltransferase [Leptolyngbya sp. SIO1D8]|nr:WecB/TagA/CpsF family glycosyltransferase [Leptolyngbya sp. SIO1D8]
MQAKQLQKQLETLNPADSISYKKLLNRPQYGVNRFNAQLNGISQVEFLGLRFHRMTQSKAIETILDLVASDDGYRVFFVNAHSIEVAQRNQTLSGALQRSHLLLADGSGVLWGSHLMGKSLNYNLNGTDLIPALCKTGGAKGLSVYFLGAKPGIAERAAKNLANLSPGMKVAGYREGYFDKADTEVVLQNIRAAKPDVLLVAMGTPLQEIWIDQYASQLPGIICLGVGGLFDFAAGEVTRAPLWVRSLGFEWLWRLLVEPKRLWKRYTLGNIVYIRLLLKARVQKTWRTLQIVLVSTIERLLLSLGNSKVNDSDS